MNGKWIGWIGALAMFGSGCAADDADRAASVGSGIGSGAGATDANSGGEPTSTAGSEGSGSGLTTSGGDDGSDDAAGTDSVGFDVGNGDTADSGPLPEGGCQAVDFLFVIDNSISMQNEQAALVGAFPGFMAAIEATLEAGSDYHIMVADTDAWGRCDTANPWDGYNPGHNSCNNYIEQQVFDECDRVMGAGVLHPAGGLATNAVCQPAGGNRYIEEGEPDLTGTFACMATVGTAGHPAERPMDAMVAAMQPAINAAGGCNEGFLRDDALLVITFVSDDPNYEDQDGPQQWYEAVVAAKNGDPSGVVVLGMTPAWPECNGSGVKGSHWAEFIELWGDHGLHGSVCSSAEDYIEFFETAVSTIEQACDEFIPPG